MLTLIPFSGFYQSAHDAEIDRALDLMLSDESGDAFPGLVDHAWRGDFRHIHDAYAAAYAARFLSEFGIVGEFESMQSPREYNFTTDRLFCIVPDAEMARILTETPRETLDACAAEWFTSRSGFISSYSPDVDDWGPLADWDHNQCGCLMAAYVIHKRDGEPFGGWEEAELMEDWFSNGNAENALCECPVLLRLANIASYLRKRQDRAYSFA